MIQRSFHVVLLATLCAVVATAPVFASGKRAGGEDPRAVRARTGEVIIGFTSEPSHFDPLQGYETSGSLIFSRLVESDVNENIVGDLAESWTVSDDALVYTFKLRKGVVFSDGSPLAASDVAFTFNKVKDNATSVDLSAMKSCTAPDASTVVITLSKPNVVFIVTITRVGIVPEKRYGPDFGKKPVGSGPFKLVQWDVGQQFILEKNERYYGAKPALNRAVFVTIKDEDAQLIAARSGTVDIVATGAMVAANTTIPGMRLLQEKSLDNMGIVMPTIPSGSLSRDGNPAGNDITCDVAFRKALAYGIDRRRISEEALSGFAAPAYSENDGMPWSNPQSRIETDLSYAQKLLDDAGWKDTDGDGIRERNGVRASIRLLYFAGDSTRQAVAMSVSGQARRNLGIEIIVEGISSSALSSRMYSETLILAWGSSNPLTSYMLFYSSNAGNNDWYNPESFRNAVVDGYLDKALASKTLEESIQWWQKAQWDGSTGTSMRGDCPYIFLINRTHLYWSADSLDTGTQRIHAHGDAWPLVINLRDWKWR